MFTNRKKGSPKSVLIVFFFGLVMSLSAIFGHYLLGKLNTLGMFQYGIISQGMNTLSLVGNGGVAFLMFALIGVIFFRGFKISLHPIFMVPGIIIIGISGFALAQISNLFWSIFTATPGLSASAEQFGFILSFTKNLPRIGMITIGLLILIMIGRWRA